MSSTFHAAQLSKSPRLQRALKALREAGFRGLTTRELIQKANVCAVNSVIAELRENDIDIRTDNCGRGEDGSRIYSYTLRDS